ncbi:MAG: hypothetical protein JNK85_29010 [Verrucomicrobiales bacterium]|nr:hypothetical protein [Verrucomicrobiales bacterium]
MKPHSVIPAGYSPRPLVIRLQPGQCVTIVGVDENGNLPPGASVPEAGDATTAAHGRIGDSPSRNLDSPSRRLDSPSRRLDSPKRHLSS